VGSVDALRAVLSIVEGAAAEAPLVVVVSALSGVTDRLEAALDGARRGTLKPWDVVNALLERHLDLLDAVTPTSEAAVAAATLRARSCQLAVHLDVLRTAGHASAADRAAVLATGERLSVPIVASALRARGLLALSRDAAEIIRTNDRFEAAAVDFATTRTLAAAALGTLPAHLLPVVTGFVAATPAGQTTILGRGGSDYTAAILGWALDADRVEIWSDVDGVMNADPRIVSAAVTLPRLSYAQARALAKAGAKVLHPKTLDPLERARIPVLVRNTFRPTAAGTRIDS
jgi:aspartokinase/homoserine dehydrogenase 1